MSIRHLRGQLITQKSMAAHTSWRVGGPAQRFYQPADQADLITFLQQLPAEEPIYWWGLGSNCLVRDGGITGTVISLQKTLTDIRQLDAYTLRVEAGVACGTLARYCARLGLAGGEFWAGIPGTIGGALAMNAGCHGGETWQYVSAVEVLDKQGNWLQRKPTDYQIAYRQVIPPAAGECFLAGHFRFSLGDSQQSLDKIRDLLAHRTATQPANLPSCGSVFRNPPQQYAAQLIEGCGLKGFHVGGAYVSPKHANFIINDGTATAADIESLINQIIEKVYQVHDLVLHKEVHIIGDLQS